MFIKLQSRGVLQLEGPDTVSFLQGLITQDMALLETQTSLYTCLLTPQGKIMFDFFIFKIGYAYLIDGVKEDMGEIEARLTMYKLRSDLTISNVSDDYCVVVDDGSSAKLPDDPRQAELGGRMIMAHDDTQIASIDDAHYHTARLKAGIAEGSEIGGNQFFPHECNMDQISGVSFTKGCFIGQEVVSRMAHKTVVRKRILPYHFSSGEIETGSPITCEGQKLGINIMSKAGHGLAMIRLDRLDSHNTDAQVRIGDVDISLYKPGWANIASRHLSEAPS